MPMTKKERERTEKIFDKAVMLVDKTFENIPEDIPPDILAYVMIRVAVNLMYTVEKNATSAGECVSAAVSAGLDDWAEELDSCR